jgi:AraC-like DNA-binding protein
VKPALDEPAMQKIGAAEQLAIAPTAAGVAARLAVAELERRNIDSAPLLVRSRLSAAGSLANSKRVSVAAQIAFLELASQASGDDWLGLDLAQQFDLRELGMLYYVAASSSSLGEALRRLERYARLGNEALVVKVGREGACSIGLSYFGVARHLDRHQIELFAAGLLRLCRHLAGQKLVPRDVLFVHHRAGDLRRPRAVFGCDVHFGAATDELRFDTAVWDLPLASKDPFLNDLMVADCEAAMAARASNVSPLRSTVENLIGPLLPHAEAQAASIAKKLGLSERTFARRLAAEGFTFREILDDLRRDLATHYLEQRHLQISQIAWLLGFNQPSAFSHACHRWFGTNPQSHRRAVWSAKSRTS